MHHPIFIVLTVKTMFFFFFKTRCPLRKKEFEFFGRQPGKRPPKSKDCGVFPPYYSRVLVATALDELLLNFISGNE